MQYSYEAQEDNEMDLVEGELIEQIEQLITIKLQVRRIDLLLGLQALIGCVSVCG